MSCLNKIGIRRSQFVAGFASISFHLQHLKMWIFTPVITTQVIYHNMIIS